MNTFGPLLCVPYASDLRTSKETTLGTFEEDTAITATHEEPTRASLNFQEHIYITVKMAKEMEMKLNESESSHIMITFRKRPLPCSQHQPNYHNSNRSSKIPENALRLHVKLERTHCQGKETNR